MSVKSAINSINSFISKYGDEALSVARALTSMLDGLALKPKDAAKVKEAIDKLENAAHNITNSSPLPTIKINKSDIEETVINYLDSHLVSIVREYLEARDNEDATPPDNNEETGTSTNG